MPFAEDDGAKLSVLHCGAKLSWCQIVLFSLRCQIVPFTLRCQIVPFSWRCQIVPFSLRCQIVLGAKLSSFTLLVPNCPGAKLSSVPNCPRCQIVQGAKLSPNRLTGPSLFLFFSWTYFCDESVNQCHVRISDDLYPVRNCDMGEVYTLVILKTKSLQDFTQLQVWGLLLAASFLLLLLELAADKVYFFFFFDPDHLTRCIENLKMLMARWTTDLKTIFTCTC